MINSIALRVMVFLIYNLVDKTIQSNKSQGIFPLQREFIVRKALTSCSSQCTQIETKRLWVPSCEEAIQLAYGTLVVLLGCPIVHEIMHEGAPEVFLHQ